MTYHEDHINWQKILSFRACAFTIFGVALALVALKGFMIPNHFLDGGITGISILAHEIFHIPVSFLLMTLNLPFIYIGYKKVGKTFAMQTFLAILLLSIAIHFISVPTVTHDKILIAMFGGLLIGAGIGMVIRGGGVIDGMEVVVHQTQKKIGLSSGEMVLFINSSIFLIAAIFLGIEPAMYSILTYFTAVKTTEYIVDGFEEFIAMNVISSESEEVKRIIVKEFNKAISVYKGERGFLPQSFHVSHDCDIVVTIVTRLEIYRIQEAIKEVDSNAFIYVQRIKEVKGGVGKHTAKH
jgi:uncharacterized membrane-anchored protein YitT (DUF2179 family)